MVACISSSISNDSTCDSSISGDDAELARCPRDGFQNDCASFCAGGKRRLAGLPNCGGEGHQLAQKRRDRHVFRVRVDERGRMGVGQSGERDGHGRRTAANPLRERDREGDVPTDGRDCAIWRGRRHGSAVRELSGVVDAGQTGRVSGGAGGEREREPDGGRERKGVPRARGAGAERQRAGVLLCRQREDAQLHLGQRQAQRDGVARVVRARARGAAAARAVRAAGGHRHAAHAEPRAAAAAATRGAPRAARGGGRVPRQPGLQRHGAAGRAAAGQLPAVLGEHAPRVGRGALRALLAGARRARGGAVRRAARAHGGGAGRAGGRRRRGGARGAARGGAGGRLARALARRAGAQHAARPRALLGARARRARAAPRAAPRRARRAPIHPRLMKNIMKNIINL
ncbi:200 kDa antigen p200 [Gracilaria domingensis]|nr:200 kDa antigen p200 [Gracilaria domingensis]